MKFGGHETFALRTNWLPNGVRLLHRNAAAFTGAELADALGVGSNMAKSINHWLTQADLAERPERGQPPRLTPFGKLVQKHDPYFLKRGTWWAIHINLATRPNGPAAWRFFFGHHATENFDREACLGEFMRWTQERLGKQASSDTKARDLSCLLSSYATAAAAEHIDPEDGSECPLRQLGLLEHSSTSGHYRRSRGQRELPAAILAYACARMQQANNAASGKHSSSIDLEQAMADPCGPYRVLGLSLEAYADAMQAAAGQLRQQDFKLEQLAGSRSLTLRNLPPHQWLEQYYTAAGVRRRKRG